MDTPNSQHGAYLRALCLLRPVYWAIGEAPGVLKKPDEYTDAISNTKDSQHGIFICPNELGENRNPQGNLRHESNVIRFTSVFVDMDEGTPDEQLYRINNFRLPPSMLVRTGRGVHAYWILDRFEEVDPTHWRSVQKAMALILAGDQACVDPARLMRLPGTYHVKGEPKPIDIIALDETRVYSIAEFPRQEVRQYKRTSVDSVRINYGRPPKVILIREGERHAALIREGSKLFRRAAPSEINHFRAMLKAWYAQSCESLKPEWEQEVDDFIDDWLIKKEFGNFKP